jgi:hypothetical protein
MEVDDGDANISVDVKNVVEDFSVGVMNHFFH